MVRDIASPPAGCSAAKSAGPACSRAARRRLGHPVQQRQVDAERRAKTATAAPLHVLPPHVALSELHDVRRDQPRVLHRAARAHEHAAPGADHAQRPGVLRGGAGAGGAYAARGARSRRTAAEARARPTPSASCTARRSRSRTSVERFSRSYEPTARRGSATEPDGRPRAWSRDTRSPGRRRRAGGLDHGGERAAEPRRDAHQGVTPR